MMNPYPTLEPTSPPAAPALFSMDGGIDYAAMQDMRFDKLYGYVTKGEWPPRTDTNLLSYGLVSLKNEYIGINGKKFFSIGEVTIDARGWHWFVPTDARFTINDVVYDLAAMSEFVAVMEPAVAATGEPPFPPEMIALLTKYGLDKPSLDMAFGWKWNANTGAAIIDMAYGVDQLLRADVKFEGGLPTFKQVSDQIPDNPEQADTASISEAFGSSTSLKSIELNVIDEGGLEKIYGMIAEAGAMMPPDQGGAMMANQTPQSIRALATAGAYMLADQAEMGLPGSRPLLAPFGAFMEKGGRVKFTAKPKSPMVAATIGERINEGELTPDAFLKELNATTVHTPPRAGN
jgi:hypothetical protein